MCVCVWSGGGGGGDNNKQIKQLNQQFIADGFKQDILWAMLLADMTTKIVYCGDSVA